MGTPSPGCPTPPTGGPAPGPPRPRKGPAEPATIWFRAVGRVTVAFVPPGHANVPAAIGASKCRNQLKPPLSGSIPYTLFELPPIFAADTFHALSPVVNAGVSEFNPRGALSSFLFHCSSKCSRCRLSTEM